MTDQDLGDPDDNYILFDDQGAPVPAAASEGDRAGLNVAEGAAA